MKLSPQDWQQAEPLFAEAMDLAPGPRADRLRELREKDARLADVLA